MSEDATLDEFVDTKDENTDERNRITGFGTFPSEWDKKDIVQCANIRDSERIPLNSQEREAKKPGDIPYYGANGVLDYINEYIFNSELILLAEDGGHFEEYQERPVAYRISGKAWVNNHAHILEAKEGTETEYLFYSLEHRNLVPYVSGSTRSKLTQTMLKKVKIPHPSLYEQSKISTVLSTVDQAIQKTAEIIDQTERIGKGLRDSLFTEGYYEHETEPYGTLGDVPADWEKTRLYKISDVARGKFTHRPRNDPEFYDGEYPFIQTGEVVKSVGELTDFNQTLNEKGKEVSREFAPGTIIITIAGNIGDTAVATFPVYFPDSLVGITPDEDVDEHFLEHFLRYRQNFLNRLSTKTTQKNLNLTLLRPIEVIKPPLEEQQEIAQLLTTVDNRIKKEREYKHQLERLKQGLMQDLLSGTVRTTDTNIEVPDEIAQHG